jgi:hypothetical protein
MKWQCRYQESALRGRIALPYGLDQDDPASVPGMGMDLSYEKK